MKYNTSLRLNNQWKEMGQYLQKIKTEKYKGSNQSKTDYLANQSNDVQVGAYFYWSVTPLFSKYFDPENKKKEEGMLNLSPFLNVSSSISHNKLTFPIIPFSGHMIEIKTEHAIKYQASS